MCLRFCLSTPYNGKMALEKLPGRYMLYMIDIATLHLVPYKCSIIFVCPLNYPGDRRGVDVFKQRP